MVNDSLGHGAGDELLVAVAARLSALHGPEDTVARFGGDEFAILVADHGPADLDQVAERVMVSFRQPFVLGTDEVTVHASIGLALGQAETDDAGDLIRNADVAMYVAKRNGKDRCEVFEASMYEAARRRLEVAGELHGAIGRGELVLHYQPVVELHNGRIVGAEALVRWQHPERGFLPPSEFIPIAETRAVIITLGRWVLNAACRQVAAWRREGIVDPEFYVTVNLSARHVQDPGVVDDVVSALRDADLPASAIVIEVTESTLIHDLERTRITLAELKRVGVRLAVDDFGTGYSSLSYLGSFPVDLVKIDKSFVDHVAKTPSGAALVRAVVELAHGLGLKAVAEGVEERDQAVALEGLGCTLAQGYLFARPLPAEGLAAAVAADHAVNAPVGAAHR
jgi:diguanylate cyclase (GGDEF)-like protein